MRFVAQRAQTAFAFPPTPPKSNLHLSEIHFSGQNIISEASEIRFCGRNCISEVLEIRFCPPKAISEASKVRFWERKCIPTVFFTLPLLGKKKSNATSKKVALPYIIRNRINGSINLDMNGVYHLSCCHCATCE